MKSLDVINLSHIIELGISPNEGDIAIVSIDNIGTPGILNRLVLNEYGYTLKDLPKRDNLGHGFSQIPAINKKKAILFVVTVSERDTRENLETNLFNTLVEFRGWFRGRKLWIPLMGTGKGGLSLEESYTVMVLVINRFQQEFPMEAKILISIPNIPEGKELLKLIRNSKTTDNSDLYAENLRISSVDELFVNEDSSKEPVSTIPTYQKKETIAGLVSDSDKGTDYLDIQKDVSAFARVVSAKSFEPPLAIALFGKWGSGKSFFMRKLQEQITKLSSHKEDGIYCEGIAHIHFNAWSYMDSNLWASIVTKIFEELNGYISENSKSDKIKQQIEKELTDKLSFAKEEIGMLESKRKSVNMQINSLKGKRKTINKELDAKIRKVKTETVWQLIKNADAQFNASEQILKVINENDSYIKTEADLKEIVPEKYWSDPEKTYQLAKSRFTFLKEFFRKDKFCANLTWLLLILLIIIVTPLILNLFFSQINKTNFLIPQTAISLLITGGAIWRRYESVYNTLQPIIASFWKIKESYEDTIKIAKSKFEQEEKALKLEIEKGKSEVLLIQEQIQKAETIKTDIDFRINNALATEALYSFIDRRSKSDDYKKHLGLISIIRRDFEILNDLFSDHNEEAEKIKNAKDFRDKFKKPLERIILYIDDLDRCPEENVVQVLEAVNLLMAFPLFIVIVGVDSRWVKNALFKKHALQFNDEKNERGFLEPANYLEKIFQIPFHLKDANDLSVKDMIKVLAQNKANIPSNNIYNSFDVRSLGNYSIDINQENSISDIDSPQVNVAKAISIDRPEALLLTDIEIALMQDMSEIIGNNPRAIKRYVNTYRIIKAHEEFDYEVDSTNQELVAILFLLALPLGKYRNLLLSFETYIQDYKNELKHFSLYLQLIHSKDEFSNLKHQLDVVLSKKSSFGILQRMEVGILNKHNLFIRRFTFNHI